MQAARQTAQNTKIAVKTTAKAVTHAIKALMEAIKALLSGLTAGGWIAVVILIIVILYSVSLKNNKDEFQGVIGKVCPHRYIPFSSTLTIP